MKEVSRGRDVEADKPLRGAEREFVRGLHVTFLMQSHCNFHVQAVHISYLFHGNAQITVVSPAGRHQGHVTTMSVVRIEQQCIYPL
jgi:hypothetical protein